MSEEGITDALLPCPFCGGEARLRTVDLDERDAYGRVAGAVCKGCGASSAIFHHDQPMRGHYAKRNTADPKAIAAWNTRQSSLPPVKGTIVERVARAIYAAHPVIEFYERGPTDPPGNRWLTWDQIPQGHRDRMVECATAAIESMPIQKMVEGLEYIVRQDGKDSNGLIDWQRCVDRIQDVSRSLLASVRSDGDGV